MSKLTHYSPVTKSIMPCTGRCKYGENTIEYDEHGNEFQVIHSREGETEEEFLQRIQEYEEQEAIKREGTILGTITKKSSMQAEVNQVSQSMRQQGKLGGQEHPKNTSAATQKAQKTSTTAQQSKPVHHDGEPQPLSEDDYSAKDKRMKRALEDVIMSKENAYYTVQKYSDGEWRQSFVSEETREYAKLAEVNKTITSIGDKNPAHLSSYDRARLDDAYAQRREIKQRIEQYNKKVSAAKTRMQKLEEDKKKAAQRKKASTRWRNGQKRAQTLLNREKRPEYIQSIDEKHITGTGAGSKFTDDRIKKTEDVIALANVQRGNLDGDDRDKLIAAGADPNSFLPPESGVRYLMVETKGSEALKDTAKMNDDDVVHIVAKGRNDGKPPSMSFVVDVKEQPKTEVGTIIVGPDSDENKQPIPNTEILWTTHPGVPTRGIRSATVREKGFEDGDTLTVKELRETFGRDVVANTRLVE